MTNKAYQRAEEIQKQIKDLNTLYYIACKPYQKFFLTKKLLWVSTYDKEYVSVCDEGLNKMIREYCEKRIKELREEMDSL